MPGALFEKSYPLDEAAHFDQLNTSCSRSFDRKCLAAGELLKDLNLLGKSAQFHYQALLRANN